jgi:rubrerythrin
MELEQALAVAIDYETRVRDHYANGEKEIMSPEGKKIFRVMAAEEQRHLEYLLSRLEEWKKTGHIASPELSTDIPSLDILEQAKIKLTSAQKGHVATQGELELLKTALELERTTSGFYQDLVAKLPPQYQPLFSRFLDIECGHLAIVQAEIDAIAGHGHWFDFMEFDLEAG